MDDTQVFRPAYLPLFAGILVAGTICCALITVGLQLSSYRLPGVFSFSFLRILCIVYLWATVCAAIIVWVLSVRVSSSGLKGRTFWGNACTMAWQDVESAARTGVPGLRFVRLFSFRGGAPMWVPLFLKNAAEFRVRVFDSVSETHPIRAAL